MSVNPATPAQASTNAGGGDPASVPAAAPVVTPVVPATPAADPAAVVVPEVKTDPAAPEIKKAETPAVPEVKKEEVPVVPEKYELKLSEGSTLASKVVDEVAEFAKANKLTNDQAQAILNREENSSKALVDNQKLALQAQREGWHAAAMKDAELGGVDGKALAENIEHSTRALKRFGSPELLNVLDETGIGNYPELIRTFAKVGRAMAPDKVVHGNSPSGTQKSPQEIVYAEHYKQADT